MMLYYLLGFISGSAATVGGLWLGNRLRFQRRGATLDLTRRRP